MSIIAQLVVLAILVSADGCGFGAEVFAPAVQGSGTSTTEKRETAAFTRVQLEGSPDVTITIGQPRSVTVTADDNIVPLIETEVHGGDTLVITSHQNYSSRVGVHVNITVESLDGVTVTGSGNISATGVKSPKLAATVTGSGNVRVDGGGDAIDCTVSGSGNIDAVKFTAARGAAHVTGSGNVKLNATESLDAQVTGSGDVRFAGSPKSVQRSVTGSGSVKPM